MGRRAETDREYVRIGLSIPTGLHSEVVAIIQSEGRWMDIGEFIRDVLIEKVECLKGTRERRAASPEVGQ